MGKITIQKYSEYNRYTIGIDLFFLNGDSIKNISNIPIGIHVFHITDLENNCRIAKIINIKEINENIYIKIMNDGIIRIEKQIKEINDLYNEDEEEESIEYSQLENKSQIKIKWEEFKFDESLYNFIENKQELILTTHDCSFQEINEINNKIKTGNKEGNGINENNVNGYQINDQYELLLSDINVNKAALIRIDRIGCDRTKDYLDKSWYIKNKWNKLSNVIQELKFTFIGLIIVNNFSCFQQFKNIVKLLLNCEDIYQLGDGDKEYNEQDKEMSIIEIFKFLYNSIHTFNDVNINNNNNNNNYNNYSGEVEHAIEIADIIHFNEVIDEINGFPIAAHFYWSQLQSAMLN